MRFPMIRILVRDIIGMVALPMFAVGVASGQEQGPVEPHAALISLERMDWFFTERAYPWGFIPANARPEALQETGRMLRAQLPAPLSTWTSIGPQPTSTPFNVPVETGRV